MADERAPIQGGAGVDCPCGGRMLYKRPSDPASDVACPRCGRTPLDLVRSDSTDRLPTLAETFAKAHWRAGHHYCVEGDDDVGYRALCECGEHVGYPDSPDYLILPA